MLPKASAAMTQDRTVNAFSRVSFPEQNRVCFDLHHDHDDETRVATP
jgi:hypothetical protein